MLDILMAVQNYIGLIGSCSLYMSSPVQYSFSLSVIFRRQNGENKPLTVPKDINLHLEKAPVNSIDALGKTITL